MCATPYVRAMSVQGLAGLAAGDSLAALVLRLFHHGVVGVAATVPNAASP
jgi:hypothetical protein